MKSKVLCGDCSLLATSVSVTGTLFPNHPSSIVMDITFKNHTDNTYESAIFSCGIPISKVEKFRCQKGRELMTLTKRSISKSKYLEDHGDYWTFLLSSVQPEDEISVSLTFSLEPSFIESVPTFTIPSSVESADENVTFNLRLTTGKLYAYSSSHEEIVMEGENAVMVSKFCTEDVQLALSETGPKSVEEEVSLSTSGSTPNSVLAPRLDAVVPTEHTNSTESNSPDSLAKKMEDVVLSNSTESNSPDSLAKKIEDVVLDETEDMVLADEKEVETEPKTREKRIDDDSEEEEEEEEDYSEDEDEEEEEEEDQDAPKKLIYNQDYLLAFKDLHECKAVPEDMPKDLEIYIGNTLPKASRQRKGRSGGKSSGKRKGKRKGSNSNEPRPSGPSLLKTGQANSWKQPTRVVNTDEEKRQEVLRKANGILNKLTYENFTSLLDQLVNVGISDVNVLRGIIQHIVEKALSAQKFSKIYAQLCVELQNRFPKFADGDKEFTFRKLLLESVQEKFYGNNTENESLRLSEDLTDFEIETKLKARELANIKFIGELFLLKMLSSNIIIECVVRLLGRDMDVIPPEDSLECFCKLISTTGKQLDEVSSKKKTKENDFMDFIFETHLEALKANANLPIRSKFLIMNLMDLRKDNWIPRRKESGPMTIKEVHDQAKKDEMKERQSISRSAESIFVGRKPEHQESGWGGNRRLGTPSRESSAPQKKHELKFSGRRAAESRAQSDARGFGGKSSQPAGDEWEKPGRGKKRGGRGGGNNSNSAEWETVGRNIKGSRGGNVGHQPRGWKTNSEHSVPILKDPHDTEKMNAFSALSQLSNSSPPEDSSPPRESSTPKFGKGPGFRVRSRQTEDSGKQDTSRNKARGQSTQEVDTPRFTEAQMDVKIPGIIAEYVDNEDPEESSECIKEWECPSYHYKFVYSAVAQITKASKVTLISTLLQDLVKSYGTITTDQITKGLEKVMEEMDDIAEDIPNAPIFTGQVIGYLLASDVLPQSYLQTSPTLKSLDSVYAAKIVANVLETLYSKKGAEEVKAIIDSCQELVSCITAEKLGKYSSTDEIRTLLFN